MKNLRKVALATLLFFVAFVATHAQQYPKSTGYVNDFAQVLTPEQGGLLNKELIDFKKKTTIEIAIVTVPWLNNQSIENYTRNLAKEWGVGKQGKNNGIVFLVALKEHKMRIETASGVRSVFTDNRADKIRDDVIIPLFKSGNMAQGIVDGTHAIMQATTKEETVQTPPSVQREWTSSDTETLCYILGGIAVVILLLFLIVPPVRRSNARKYVLENKGRILDLLSKANKISKNSDVKEETRKKFTKLKDQFSLIDNMEATDKRLNWLEAQKELDSLEYPFYDITSEMKKEVAFAEKARKEGPELLKKIPELIEIAEKKLTEGKESKKAIIYLDKARTQYLQIQNQQSGMSVVDWVILYAILTDIQSNTANAESTHQYSNSDHSDSYSSRSNSDNSDRSYGFGSNDGFSGGGGFDSGGTSGSW